MKIIPCSQGSREWHLHRASSLNASDAAAVLGISPYKTRSDLIREKATGITQVIDEATQRLFDKGHEYEAIARPWAEEIIGEELYPVVIASEIDGLLLSASLDGVTLLEDITFEHKTLNKELEESLKNGIIPDQYKPQMEQGLLISGAEKCLFMASAGIRDEMKYAWYKSDPVVRSSLLAGWKQFDEDVKNYQHVEEAPKMEGKAPETLPALRIELTGMVSSSNLPEFKRTALAVISAVNTDLQTDADFLDAEKAVKWCKEVETRLDAAKQHALSQTATIDELFRTLDEIKEEARTKRLYIEKLVKTQKDSIRIKIMGEAEEALREHYATVNATLPYKMNMPADFKAKVAEAMKGKKTVASLREAATMTLTTARIDSNLAADMARTNLAFMDVHMDNAQLFPDIAKLIYDKEPDDFQALVKSRIADHKEAERKKEEALRERIRKEEEAKALKAAEAERERIRNEEAAKAEAEYQRQQEYRAEQALEIDIRPIFDESADIKPKVRERGDGYMGGVNMDNDDVSTPTFKFQAPPENTASDMDVTLAWLKSLRNGDGLIVPSGLTDKKCLGAIEEVVKKVQVVVKTVITKLEK